jgi:hypothetical protein
MPKNVFAIKFAKLYPLYVQKRKARIALKQKLIKSFAG